MKEKNGYYKELIPDKGVSTWLTTRHETLNTLVNKEGIADTAMIQMNQVHSASVFFLDKNINVEGQYCIEQEVDAALTCRDDVVLSVRTADCLPLLIYHSYPFISVIHAGRKGTQNGITGKVFDEIIRRFGIRDGFHIWFGPAICQKCYQIDQKNDIHYDLIKENMQQIRQKIDLSETRIYYSGFCTSCSNDIFHSYRKEGDKSGRIYSLAKLNKADGTF
ncbi:MAG: polyphenol oxidase family protein [bacterium]|nr:polyphenol oxidase family protein [bacterium]